MNLDRVQTVEKARLKNFVGTVHERQSPGPPPALTGESPARKTGGLRRKR